MKARHYKPEALHTVTPYLIVDGALKLLDFMKATFGAEELECYRTPDGRVMHGRVRIGDSMVEFADGNQEWQPMRAGLHIYVPNVDEVHAKAIAAGGVSRQDPKDQFYGERSSAVDDPCGNQWYIATLVEELSAEELQARTPGAQKT